MANTFELISSVTVGSGGAASIDFNTITADWTDLVLVASTRTNSTDTPVWIFFNNDQTEANYSVRRLLGAGSGTPSSAAYSSPYWSYTDISSDTSSTFASTSVYIPNYAGSTYKSISSDVVTENNSTTALAVLNAGIWNNTAAVTRITLKPVSGSFVQYSTAYLYGVKNA